MLSHVHIGVTDFDRAFAFYEAVMKELGHPLKFVELERPWAGWKPPADERPLFVIGRPFDGEPHAVGNGQMTAFMTSTRETVDRVYTHKPLAIYVPRKYVDSWRLGRREYIFRKIQESHEEIELDRHRHYAVIYEWVKGIDADKAFADGIIDQQSMNELVTRSHQDTRRKGFFVQDNKPHHIIIRPTHDHESIKDRNGNILYALVDFELLERTPQQALERFSDQ